MADSTQKKAAALVVLGLGAGAAIMLGMYFGGGGGQSGTFTAATEAPAEQSSGFPTPENTLGVPEKPTGEQGVTGAPEATTPTAGSSPSGSNVLPSPIEVAGPGQGTPGPQKPQDGAKSGPAGWPASVTFPTKSELIEEDRNGHVRFVLMTSSGIATTGGQLVAELADKGWDVSVVGTVRSATITARRGKESLGIALRDQSTPQGPLTHWDLVYQQEPPPIPDPEPSPSGSLQERA